MKIRLYILLGACGLTIAGLVVHGQEKGTKAAPHENHASDKGAAATKTSDMRVTVVNEPAADREQNGTEKHSESYLCRLFAPENLPNVGLFFVGFAGVIVALCTLNKIKDQTISAKNQLDAFIAEKRAWILLDGDESGIKITPPHLIPAETVGNKDPRLSHCTFHIKNFGNTPARLTFIKAVLQLGTSSAVPPAPGIDTVEKIGKTRSIPIIFPPERSERLIAELSPQGIISQFELNAVETEEKFVWFQGVVKYRQTLIDSSVEHTSQFCYVWEIRTKTGPYWRSGPQEANDAK